MACLHGIDVEAAKCWGGLPDLDISGPNQGTDAGRVNKGSSTLNAMRCAA